MIMNMIEITMSMSHYHYDYHKHVELYCTFLYRLPTNLVCYFEFALFYWCSKYHNDIWHIANLIDV